MAGRLALAVTVAALAAAWFAGCEGETRTTTVTAEEPSGIASLKAFAFSETKQQARRTCSSIPREVLTRGFAQRSSDRPFGDDLDTYDDNAIGLLYVEDIGSNPIRLQHAAYKGCLAGLNQAQSQRPARAVRRPGRQGGPPGEAQLGRAIGRWQALGGRD